MRPIISVIIPVYNVANYLPRCIDSLLNQQERNFEILLIDDGSTDESGDICDNYAKTDSRIKVFHKFNGGVSSARNVGLDNAKGDWVVFVDSDDEVTEDYLTIPEEFVDCDVVQKGFKEKQIKVIADYKLTTKFLQGNENIGRFYVNRHNAALWDKLISRNIIQDKRFNSNIKIGEDFLFFISLISNVKKYALCDKGQYIYHKRVSSAMNDTPILIKIEHRFMVCEELKFMKFGRGIIISHYIPNFWKWRKILTKSQKAKFDIYMKNIKFSSLYYLDFKNKMKFFMVYIKYHMSKL